MHSNSSHWLLLHSMEPGSSEFCHSKTSIVNSTVELQVPLGKWKSEARKFLEGNKTLQSTIASIIQSCVLQQSVDILSVGGPWGFSRTLELKNSRWVTSGNFVLTHLESCYFYEIEQNALVRPLGRWQLTHPWGDTLGAAEFLLTLNLLKPVAAIRFYCLLFTTLCCN